MGRVLLLAAAAAVVFGGDPVAKNWEPQNDDEKLLKFRIKPMKSYVSSALIGLQSCAPGVQNSYWRPCTQSRLVKGGGGD